jgi:type II secretory pathway component GspD/PulD (secretin)
MNKNIIKRGYILFIFFSYLLYLSSQTLQQKISVKFKDANISTICNQIAQITNINIICDVPFTGTFTQEFNNIELGAVLSYICEKANCQVKEEKPNLIRLYRVPPVKMDFKETPFVNAVRAIAEHARVNIIIDEEVVKANKTVTAKGDSVPFEEALKILTTSAGFYIIEEKFRIYRITTFERLAEQLETKSFKLRYIRPPSYVRAIIKTDYAQTTPPATKEGEESFTLLNLIKSMMTKKGNDLIGSLNYDEKTNTLIVKDTKVVLKKIEELIREVDVEPGKILIDTYFITTLNTDLFRVGINYSTAGPAGDNEGWTFTTVPNKIPADVSTAPGGTTPSDITQQPRRSVIPFGFGHTSIRFDTYIGRVDDFLTASIRLFKKDSLSKIIQQPTILALDHHEATIFVGDTIRWAEATTSVSGTSGTPVTTLQEASKSPVQVGFQLLVIPHIIPGTDKIQLTVIPQNSSLIGTSSEVPGFDKFSTGSQTIFLPRTRSSTLVTNLIIDSGQTAVIGGLITSEYAKSLTKVPFLGDIPLIGELFKYRATSDNKIHLIIYITPRIVKSSEVVQEELRKNIQRHKESLQKEYEKLHQEKSEHHAEEDFETKHKKELEKEYEKLRNR